MQRGTSEARYRYRGCAPPAWSGDPNFGSGDLRPRLTRNLIREFARSFPCVSTCPALPVRDASTWKGGTANPEATYDIHILGGVYPPAEGRRRGRRGEAAGEGRRHRGGCRERANVAEVGCWWWLAERRRQWCRPVARWRQPWYSNPIAEGVGAAAGAAAAAACRWC